MATTEDRLGYGFGVGFLSTILVETFTLMEIGGKPDMAQFLLGFIAAGTIGLLSAGYFISRGYEYQKELKEQARIKDPSRRRPFSRRHAA